MSGGVVPRWLIKKAKGNQVRLYALLTYASAEGREPTESDLATELGLCELTVQRALRELERMGALKVTCRGRTLSNLYELRTEPP